MDYFVFVRKLIINVLVLCFCGFGFHNFKFLTLLPLKKLIKNIFP